MVNKNILSTNDIYYEIGLKTQEFRNNKNCGTRTVTRQFTG